MSLQFLWLVYQQSRRAGLGRYTVCRRFSKHATPIKAYLPWAVPRVIPCNYLAWYVWWVYLSARWRKGFWGLSILPLVPLSHVEIMGAIHIFRVGTKTIYLVPLQRALALTMVFILGYRSLKA